MRNIAIAIIVAALTGCASHPVDSSTQQQQALAPHAYSVAPGMGVALAFDPPALAGSPRLDLSRDQRGPAAFVGYQDSTTTYYYVSSNEGYSDWNRTGGGFAGDGNRDNYQRQVVTETYGVIHQ